MFDQIFGTSDYVEYPSFEVALYSLLLSFVLSAIIGLTYRFTFKGDTFPNHFFQAIVLSSMASSMVIMAVGNNLAAGFGIIGAIAIIRFRTMVRDPRNIIFIFSSLSVGIATGVYGYAIAVAGALLFCLIAIILHFSPFGTRDHSHFDLVTTVREIQHLNILFAELEKLGVPHKVLRYRKLDVETGYRYNLRLKLSKDLDPNDLFNELAANAHFHDLRIQPMEEVVL